MQCEYQRGTWECTGDGYLWDADYDGYDPDDHSHPCPLCNTKEYLLNAKEWAETTSHGSANQYSYTGESIWTRSVETAKEWNLVEAKKALNEIGTVEALRPADNKQGWETVIYHYPRDLFPE